MTWEEAILRCINSLHGEADTKQVYKHIGGFRVLTGKHLVVSKHQGRPAYYHQVRSHLSNLVQAGDLVWVSTGRYSLTGKGRQRVKG